MSPQLCTDYYVWSALAKSSTEDPMGSARPSAVGLVRPLIRAA